MKNHASANKSETCAYGSLYITGKATLQIWLTKYYNGKGFPLILKIALALEVYPSFNKEAPNVQIFLSKASRVLSVRTLAANWG